MKKKWSRFNRLLKKDDVHLLYNSLSNSFVELDKELYSQLHSLKPGDEVVYDDEEIMKLLTATKAIVVSDSHEIDKIRFTALTRRFNTGHISLTINPTLACNFGCHYCFEHSHGGSSMPKKVEDEIVDFLKSKPGLNSIGVTWFGGEPLLAFDKVESLSRAIMALGKKYRAGMISNGYLVTKEIAKKFCDLNIDYIQITLDGPEKIHDSRRPLLNGQPTFNRIIHSIDLLCSYAPNTSVNIRVNIDNDNHNEFILLYDFIKSKFGNGVRISPAFTNDSTDKGLHCICNKYQRQEFLKILIQEKGLDFSSFFPSGDRSECAVRNASACIIGPQGELYNCWNDIGNPEKVYGHLGDVNIDEVAYLKYKTCADPLNDRECLECFLFPVCNGGCPYERIKRTEEGLTPNDCPLMKEELDTYLLIHYQFVKSHEKNALH